jgi:hypothetical protein
MAPEILTIGSAVNGQGTDGYKPPLPLVSMSDRDPPGTPRRVPRPSTDKTPSPLGIRIEAAWLHAHMTQSALEARLVKAGLCSKGYLSKLRYGERGKSSVNADLVKGIAHATGVDFTWLYTGDGSMLPPRTPPLPTLTLVRTPAPSSAYRRKP